MKKTFTVQLGDIPVDASDTDGILLAKAQNYLPQALVRLGMKAGEEAWTTMEREFRKSPLKVAFSSSEKAQFIRKTAAEFTKTATPAERKNIIETIFEQLQQQRSAEA